MDDNLPAGLQQENDYRFHGASEDQINDWKMKKIADFKQHGASDEQVNQYFGVKEPDTSDMKAYVQKNLDAFKQSRTDESGKMAPHEATTFGEALQAAWQGSIPGIFVRGKGPDVLAPEHEGVMMRMMAKIPQLGLDFPVIAGGATAFGLAGATVGATAAGAAGTTVAPGLGTVAGIAAGAGAGGVAGAGFGAMAVPSAIRQLLIDHYEKKDGVKDPEEFMAHLGAVAWQATKDGIPGAAMAATGGLMAPVVGPGWAAAASYGSMMATQAAITQQMPSANEFIDNAILMVGVHAATTTVPAKLRAIYANTGEHPADIVEKANQDPVLKQEMLSENPDLPAQAKPEEPEPPPAKPNTKTVYHGTNHEYDSIDYSRGGGMAHFAEDETTAERYANDAGGSGGRTPVPFEKMSVDDHYADRTFKFDPESKTWVNENGETIPHDTMIESLNDRNSDRFSARPTNPQIRRQEIDMTRVIDTYTPEGLETLKNILKPGDKYINRLIRAIGEEQKKTPGYEGFGGAFWSLTKLSRADEINKSLKEFTKQVQNAGFEGVRFKDDSHPTIAVFDPEKNPSFPPKPPSEPPTGGGEGEKPPPNDDLQAAEDKIMSHFGKEEEAAKPKWTTWDGFKQKASKAWDSFYDAAVNKYAPLERFEQAAGGDFDPVNSPYQKALNLTGAMGKLARTIQKNTIDFKTGAVTGEGWEPIMRDAPQDPAGQRRFFAYWASERALEREQAGENQQGKETGFDLEAAQKLVDAHREEFKPIMDRISAFDNRIMEYARDAGLISDESLKNMQEKSGYYMPFRRVMDSDPFLGEPAGAAGQGSPFAFMEGSERQVRSDTIPQYLQKLQRVFVAAERNSVANALVDVVEQNKSELPLAEKVENPTGAKNEFSFFRKGEKVTYRTFQDTADALKATQAQPLVLNSFMKLLQAPAKWLRFGTVETPDFMTRHLTRQIETGLVYSDSVSRSPLEIFKAPVQMASFAWDSFKGLVEAHKKTDAYYQFLSSGATAGEFGSVMKYFEKQDVWRLGKKDAPQEIGSYIWNVVRKAGDGLNYMAYLSDIGPRMAEFKRLGGLDEGTFGADNYKPADPEAKARAAAGAREVTLDYDRHGSQTAVLRAITPFVNIGIQGADRLRRGFVDDPVGMSTKALAAITAPTVLNWAINHKDSRYQDAPEWEKDLYWLIPTDKWEKAANIQDALSRPEDLRKQLADGSWMVNNGTTIKISKPFELGIMFGSFPERLLSRYFDQNPHELTDFIGTIVHGLTPNIVPTAVVPLVEMGVNKNFFSGRPIIPDHLKELAPELQYTEYTSMVAKTLGTMLGYVPGLNTLEKAISPKGVRIESPMVIDNWIRDYSGTMGQYALHLVDKGLNTFNLDKKGQLPDWTMSDIPIVHAFISRNPAYGMQPIQDFYEKYEEATVNINTQKKLMERGDIVGAQAYMASRTGDSYKLDDTRKALGAYADLIRGVYSDPKMSGTDKRQLIDTYYYQMWNVAKQGNATLDQIKRGLNAKK